MADTKLSALGAFTPVLTDTVYGADDPGGTPVSGSVTFAAIRTLLQANLTKAEISPANNDNGLTISGSSLTGSDATSLIDLSQTWNTTGNPALIYGNVTLTASGSDAMAIDIGVAGSTTRRLQVNLATGFTYVPLNSFDSRATIEPNGNASLAVNGGGGGAEVNLSDSRVQTSTSALKLGSSIAFGWTDNTAANQGTHDTRLYRDAANTLALRNSTNAQTFNVYNTYTDASNYERAVIKWASDRWVIGLEAAGTGIGRDGTIKVGVTKVLDISANDDGTFAYLSIANQSNTEIKTRAGGRFGWTSGSDAGASFDTAIARAAAGFVTFHRDNVNAGGFATEDAGELTIATGAVTVAGSYHTIDTESDAASDDLDTINGGTDGAWLVIQAADSARTVVAKDGTGNLQLAGDFSMDNAQDTLTLIYSGALSAWCELSRSDNGA